MIRNKTENFYVTFLIAAAVALFSYFIIGYYKGGDQFYYRFIYDGYGDLTIVEAFKFYTVSADSKEPIYFIISWFFSQIGVAKDLFISIFNVLLALSIVRLLRTWNVSYFPILTIVFSNFYILNLYFSAERLKFGVLFFVVSLLVSSRKKIFIFLSVMAHAQMLVFFCSAGIAQFLKYLLESVFKKGRISLSVFSSFFSVLIFALLAGYFLKEHVQEKLHYYIGNGDIFDLWKMMVFFALSVFYSEKKIDVLLIFIPLFFSVLVVGGERLNFFGYLVFLYYVLQRSRGVNFGFFVTAAFYCYKSIFFLQNIITYGDGYYNFAK